MSTSLRPSLAFQHFCFLLFLLSSFALLFAVSLSLSQVNIPPGQFSMTTSCASESFELSSSLVAQVCFYFSHQTVHWPGFPDVCAVKAEPLLRVKWKQKPNLKQCQSLPHCCNLSWRLRLFWVPRTLQGRAQTPYGSFRPIVSGSLGQNPELVSIGEVGIDW